MRKFITRVLFLVGGFASTGVVAETGCPPFIFSFVTDSSSCTGADGSATVTVVGGLPPYTYLWSPSAGSQTGAIATSLPVGTHTVTVTDAMSCVQAATVTIYSDPLPAPDICMVTCDASSTNNIVYWDKTPYGMADSFIVHREVMPLVYARIGAIHRDSLSEFVDTTRSVGPANGDPNAASYRYKLQIRDSCGNYGPLGPYHNTIYIEDMGSGTFSWSIPYMIEGLASPVSTYVLLCDTANVDVWGPVQVVPSTALLANDPGFATHGSIANWRVKTGWSIECTPTRATVNTSRSNIKRASLSTSLVHVQPGSLDVYPNPAQTTLTISAAANFQGSDVYLYNNLGQRVLSSRFSNSSGAGLQITLDIEPLPAGPYFLMVQNNSGVFRKKVIVQ